MSDQHRLANNPLLHPKSSQPFSDELFRSPTAEYRGTPLWSWNNKLDPDALVRQIDHFQTMGLGGFHMHSRVGLDTPYMQEDFMSCVKTCVAAAKERGMIAYLYDEDRWPSGAAGGLVTKGHPELGARHLLLTTKRYGAMEDPRYVWFDQLHVVGVLIGSEVPSLISAQLYDRKTATWSPSTSSPSRVNCTATAV
jgi:hypothetical protein